MQVAVATVGGELGTCGWGVWVGRMGGLDALDIRRECVAGPDVPTKRGNAAAAAAAEQVQHQGEVSLVVTAATKSMGYNAGNMCNSDHKRLKVHLHSLPCFYGPECRFSPAFKWSMEGGWVLKPRP